MLFFLIKRAILFLSWEKCLQMTVGRFPKILPGHFVYALFCQDDSGPGYVKIGITQNIYQRISGLRGACPVPAKYVATLSTPSQEYSRKLEKELLSRFADRSVGGEWLRFDFSSSIDKEEFNTVCRASILLVLGDLKYSWWQKTSIAEIDRVNKERKSAFNDEKIRRRILARNRSRRERSSAWGELKEYGAS